MGRKEAYQQKIEAQLRAWDAEIHKLKAKADKAEAELKIKYYEELEALRPKREAVRAKLEQLKGSSEQAWEDLKAGLEDAWNELKSAVDRARARFN